MRRCSRIPPCAHGFTRRKHVASEQREGVELVDGLAKRLAFQEQFDERTPGVVGCHLVEGGRVVGKSILQGGNEHARLDLDELRGHREVLACLMEVQLRDLSEEPEVLLRDE